jgi:peptidoglycan/xylan/chitin deacetylase (PgdA/CDA1 family)
MDSERARMPLVLMYHSVEPYVADPFHITVHPRRFDRQLGWLRRRGLRGVALRELLAARQAGSAAGLVGLTFDDGYVDFVTEVLPALVRHRFTATVFVVAGALGGHNTWDAPGPCKALMTAGDIRRAADAGMEIGSHSRTHVRLPEVDAATLGEEVALSREELVELAGEPVSGFCYPYGAVGEREVAAVRAAGYDYACAVTPSRLDSRHALPRAYIGDRDNAVRLLAKLVRHRLTTGRARRAVR